MQVCLTTATEWFVYLQ